MKHSSKYNSILGLIVFFLLFCFNTTIKAQSPAILMQKCFGGSNADYFYSMTITSDSNYLFLGGTNSNNGDVTGNHGAKDYWLVKTDFNLNLIWSKCYGGVFDDWVGPSVIINVDSTYIFGGTTSSNNGNVSGNHGNGDIWIVNTDTSGTVIWQQCYGSSNSELLGDMILDGNQFIVVGFTDGYNGDVIGCHNCITTGDLWFLKTSLNGAFQSQKCFGGSMNDDGHKIYKLADSSYLILGETNSSDFDVTSYFGGQADIWCLKIDSASNIIWQISLGGSDWDRSPNVALANDGGFLLAGFTSSNDFDVTGNHGMADIWVVKLDSLGNLIWQRCYGGTSDDWCSNVTKTSDGCFLIAGITTSNDGDVTNNQGGQQGWILKIDSVGNIIWQKCLGENGNDFAYSATELSNKTILVEGQTNFAPGVPGNHGFNDDAWVVLLDSVVATGVNEQNFLIHISVDPNPAKDHLTVSGLYSVQGTISIYDTNGTCLLSQQVTPIPQSLQINTDIFPNGMYYLKFESNTQPPAMKKFVVVH